MMTRTTAAALLVGCLTLAGCKAEPKDATAGTAPVATGAAAAGFAPGKWAMTAEITDVQATGAPAKDQREIAELRANLTGKPQTKEVCLSQADVDGGLEQLFATPGATCTVGSKQIAGGTINAAYTCRTQAGGTANIRTVGGYTADTLTTSTQIETPGPTSGTTLDMSSRTTGKRLGEC